MILATGVALMIMYGTYVMPVTYHQSVEQCETAFKTAYQQFQKNNTGYVKYAVTHACIPHTVLPGVKF